MNMKATFSTFVLGGVLLAATASSQAAQITLDPKGSPLNCGSANSAALIDCTSFQSDSVVGSLGSKLTITNYEDPTAGGSLFASYSETGQIAIDVFKLASSNVKFAGPGLGFQMWATFDLSGVGVWSLDIAGNTIFTAATGTLMNSAIYGSWGGNPAVKLADLALLPGNLQAVANATLKSTNLSASFDISPVAGSTGVGGFFLAPAMWNVDLFANNVGFGQGTGTVSPNPLVDGAPVDFTTNLFGTTPVDQGGSGSFNGAFIQPVPEPSALALVGLALFGLGVSRRWGRKQR